MKNINTDNIKVRLRSFLSEDSRERKIAAALLFSLMIVSLIVFSELGGDKYEKADSTFEYESNYIDNDELESFLENVYGAGKVEIMITYDSSKEYIYAKDTNENTKEKTDSDNEINYKSEHIIIKEDGDEKGLMIKEIYPEIRGIAVVCDGGNNPVIKEQIVNILCALFGVNSNRISVAAKSG